MSKATEQRVKLQIAIQLIDECKFPHPHSPLTQKERGTLKMVHTLVHNVLNKLEEHDEQS